MGSYAIGVNVKNFFKDNLLPLLIGSLISFVGFVSYNTIHNTARIDALAHDLRDIRQSLREIVKILMKDER